MLLSLQYKLLSCLYIAHTPIPTPPFLGKYKLPFERRGQSYPPVLLQFCNFAANIAGMCPIYRTANRGTPSSPGRAEEAKRPARETSLADRFVRWRFTVRCRLRGCWRLRGIPFLLSFEQEPLLCIVLSVRYGRRCHSSTSQMRRDVVYCPQEPRQGRPSRLRTKLNKIKQGFVQNETSN